MRITLALGAIFALFGAAVAIVAPQKQAQVNEMMNSPQVEARVIVSSAMAWQARNPGCPTIQDLVAEPYLDPAFETDPWGSRYLIECGADHFKIHSLGPDRRPNTQDDVWISRPRGR